MRLKLVALLSAVILFLGFQYLGLTGRAMLNFPGVTARNTCEYINLGIKVPEGCGCTAVGYQVHGFPFRANLYDTCGQDNSNIWYVVVANLAIQILLALSLYAFVRKLLKRRFK